MESNWDSASFPAGTLQCLLCRKSLEYVNGDRSHIMDHLNNVHSTKIHHNLILAITFLENKTLNKIVSQFEKHSKSVEEQNVDTDDDVVEEMDVVEEHDNSVVELVEENEDSDDDISVVENVEEVDDQEAVEIIEQPELEENLGEEKNFEGIDYDEILKNSEYFRKNPKQMTTNLNPDLHSRDLFPLVDPNLPSGWKVRDHKTKNDELEKHYLAPDGRVIKSKRAVIEYMKIMEKFSVENIINISQPEKPQPVFGDLWSHLSSNETSTSKNDEVKYRRSVKSESVGEARRERRSGSGKSESVGEARRERRSGSGKSESVGEGRKERRSGSGKGKECPECHKVVSMLEKHMEDMHSPPGHFPCRGCGKVFTSKNKEGSHYSRHCNPNRKK